MIAALTNHLWQSTLFAIAAALMAAVLRRNRAAVRYWLWFSASLKFSVIFSQVQEKWGLKLEPQKGPVDVLVIDHVERPSSN